MGAKQTIVDYDPSIKLHSPSHPICATEEKFCLSKQIQLRIPENFFSFFKGDAFEIPDTNDTSSVYLQCENRPFALSEKKLLKDNKGVPVLNLKQKIFSFSNKLRIFAGNGSERRICKFTPTHVFRKCKISAIFTDALNPTKAHHLVLKGNWRKKQCMIFIGDPNEDGVPIARTFRPSDYKSSQSTIYYNIEIAANVDIAICVALCIALDEYSHDY